MTNDLRTVVDTGVVVSAVLLPHPKDNKFLELALSGAGSHIVTGDSDLLVLHPFREIAIVTPQSFLTMLGMQNRSAEPSDEPDRNMPGELE